MKLKLIGALAAYAAVSGAAFAQTELSLWYHGAGNEFFAWPAMSAASAAPYTGGWAIPVGFDAVSLLALQLPGWLGTFNGSGLATATLPIPGDPAIAGLDVSFGGMVWSPGALPLGAPLSVSDPLTLTILP